ncbi:HET domain-containing protein [Microdochium nivale]|nr:HET domain-containing protein [Microdochium nivale]
MRLINTKTYQLKDFLDDSIPPYAILSHTWGENEFVHQDLLKGLEEAQRKPGFAKIEGCCRVAQQFRLDWAWIDTICIDKSSSAELSEAINSMFAWYQGAQVCFAFLSDVQWTRVFQDSYSKDVLESLRQSRWFSRGWTLQELLAPSEVVFLDRTWSKIGTKEGFSDVLESITSIRRVFLVFPKRLEDASVAERLSWASDRQTSRKEDMAYCLLGLLGINMPLLYGEGHKAFLRLQQEIIRSTYDHTLLAWGLYASPLSRLLSLTGDVNEAPPLLAPHPCAFDGWSSANRTLRQGQHYFLTNLGLHIDLLFISLHSTNKIRKVEAKMGDVTPALGLALLDCYEWSPRGRYRVALPLQLEDRGGVNTAPLARRARAAMPFLVPEIVEKEAGRLSIYLQDGTRARNVQSNAVWWIDCHVLYSNGYYLADYFPPTQVDVVQHQGTRRTSLCLVSEPGAEYSIMRFRHKTYSTVLLLVEHPSAVQTRPTPSRLTSLPHAGLPAGAAHGDTRRTDKTASGEVRPSPSAMGQLWITSTDDLKTTFEMAIQPSYSAISFDYIINEFQWMSLGNIASNTRIRPPSQSVSPWLNRSAEGRDVSEQVKVIEDNVLDRIGALQALDPVMFADEDEVEPGKGPSKDEQRFERLEMALDLAMRAQETSMQYPVKHQRRP